MGSLYGTVVDERDAPLPWVVAALRGPGAATAVETDARGEFRQVSGVVLNAVNVGGNQTGVQAFAVTRGAPGIEYEVDGVTITDPVDGGTPTSFNFDAFQEIQAATGGSDLTLRSAGATLNLVTRRGTNQVHGLARYFYSSDRWQSDNTPAETLAQGFQSNRTELLRDYESRGEVRSSRTGSGRGLLMDTTTSLWT